MTDDEIMLEDFLKDKDLGLEPIKVPLTEAENKLVSIVIGMQIAVLQFVKEGIIPPKEQVHFMLHLNDFASRIYQGEEIKVNGQTMNLTSQLSGIFRDSVDISLAQGKRVFAELKAAAEGDDKQTNKVEFDGDTVMPGDLDKTRTLN